MLQSKSGEQIGDAVGVGGNEIDRALKNIRVMFFDGFPPMLGSLAIIIQGTAEQLYRKISPFSRDCLQDVLEIVTSRSVKAG